MKNIQIIDGATNATFSLFQATDEEFAELFIDGRDMEVIEDVIDRLGDDRTAEILDPIWQRPILKRDAKGIDGTLFYDWADRKHHLPATKREVDIDEQSISTSSLPL